MDSTDAATGGKTDENFETLVKLLTVITCATSPPEKYWRLCLEVLQYEFGSIDPEESLLKFLEDWRTEEAENRPLPNIQYENDIEEKLMLYTVSTQVTLSSVLQRIPAPTIASSSSSTEIVPATQITDDQDEFMMETAVLQNRHFWEQMIDYIMEQTDQNVSPEQMRFSPGVAYVSTS